MAVNTPFSAGAVLTSSQMNALPFGVMAAPISVVANQTGITTAVDVTGASFTNLALKNGRKYLYTFQCLVQSNTANSTGNMIIHDGSAALQQIIFNADAANVDYSMSGWFIESRTSDATVTRKLRFQAQSGGTWQITAGGTFPLQFAVIDLGTA